MTREQWEQEVENLIAFFDDSELWEHLKQTILYEGDNAVFQKLRELYNLLVERRNCENTEIKKEIMEHAVKTHTSTFWVFPVPPQ